MHPHGDVLRWFGTLILSEDHTGSIPVIVTPRCSVGLGTLTFTQDCAGSIPVRGTTVNHMGYNVVIYLGFVLTSARIVRLVAADKLLEPFRDWVQHRYGAESMTTYLFYCRACLSIWVCGLLSPVVFVFGDWSWWWLPLVALSGSHLVVLLSQLED